jgi:hypothetical protein
VRAGTASSARWQPTCNAADAAREPPAERHGGEGTAAPRAASHAAHLPSTSPPVSLQAPLAAAAVPCSPFERATNTCFVVAGLTLLASLEGFAEALCAGPNNCCAVIQQLRVAFRAAVPALGGGLQPSVSLCGFLDAMAPTRCVARHDPPSLTLGALQNVVFGRHAHVSNAVCHDLRLSSAHALSVVRAAPALRNAPAMGGGMGWPSPTERTTPSACRKSALSRHLWVCGHALCARSQQPSSHLEDKSLS